MNKYPKLPILGIMSGTSLDGLDLALCDFWIENDIYNYSVIKTETIEYDDNRKNQLENVYGFSALDFCRFDVEYGNFIGEKVNAFLENIETKPAFIASHGHTIFHNPENGFTKQIGSGAAIAALTNIPTICDFRSLDVALGGQGAPLVPIGDELLFSDYDACLNLGGIANISYRYNNKRIAYDIGFCNIPLNTITNLIELKFDKDGEIARSGEIIIELLEKLNQMEYFSLKGPKSLGYEYFITEFFPLMREYLFSVDDLLCTVTHHIAVQIAKHCEGKKSILATGGGSKNKFLIDLIAAKTTAKLIIPDTQLMDFKEAIIFGFLGFLRVNQQNNALKEVTGATRNSCGGAVYWH